MKVHKLEVRRPESYERNSNSEFGFMGSVVLKGELGETTIMLTPSAISRIMQQIAQEVARTSARIADAVPHAMSDAIDGGLLLASDGEVKIPPPAPRAPGDDLPF